MFTIIVVHFGRLYLDMETKFYKNLPVRILPNKAVAKFWQENYMNFGGCECMNG